MFYDILTTRIQKAEPFVNLNITINGLNYREFPCNFQIGAVFQHDLNDTSGTRIFNNQTTVIKVASVIFNVVSNLFKG
jgi:hypothetical protein